MNQVALIGNLTKDPEFRQTTGEKSLEICRFTVAVEDGGEKKSVNYIPVVVFGRTAVNCDKFLSKGKKVGVSGKIKTGSYTNKEGKKVYTTEVVAYEVKFLSGAEGREPRREQEPEQAPGFYPAQDVPVGFEAVQEEIPF